MSITHIACNSQPCRACASSCSASSRMVASTDVVLVGAGLESTLAWPGRMLGWGGFTSAFTSRTLSDRVSRAVSCLRLAVIVWGC
jgi:hypothetical protein